ncbi:copper-binding protein [Variovorax ginsengisoli]|uniref:Cu/Ag efflux protein CusF n=1 Tax=Variovorax ginsengisoli TaxID=363844 RepID=A0ABT9S7L1_9BURK|nr:copper-binding protein [Variovorax ginsengisoli]MDP9900344.1 Cu/Ag efflux protein CusF [Variovorax ginsengisoli]
MNRLRTAATCAFALIAMASAQAQTANPAPSETPATATVFTRARVVSLHVEIDDKSYVRLKLLPRAKIPFMTQTFRVKDRSLLDGVAEGAWVKFTSRHVDSENVLTEIHVVPECVRFQRCD